MFTWKFEVHNNRQYSWTHTNFVAVLLDRYHGALTGCLYCHEIFGCTTTEQPRPKICHGISISHFGLSPSVNYPLLLRSKYICCYLTVYSVNAIGGGTIVRGAPNLGYNLFPPQSTLSMSCNANRLRALALYKELHRLGRDYPDPRSSPM